MEMSQLTQTHERSTMSHELAHDSIRSGDLVASPIITLKVCQNDVQICFHTSDIGYTSPMMRVTLANVVTQVIPLPSRGPLCQMVSHQYLGDTSPMMRATLTNGLVYSGYTSPVTKVTLANGFTSVKLTVLDYHAPPPPTRQLNPC